MLLATGNALPAVIAPPCGLPHGSGFFRAPAEHPTTGSVLLPRQWLPHPGPRGGPYLSSARRRRDHPRRSIMSSFRTILVAADFSEGTREAFRMAYALAHEG